MKIKHTPLVLLSLFATTATFAQVGIGTKTPDASAILDVKDTTKGFLPPRMTDAQRDAMGSPQKGMTIYNTTENCLQWYNSAVWFSSCSGLISPAPKVGGSFTNGFENNTRCTTNLISVTPCAAVAGASRNDDINTADGIEYDWSGATGYVAGGNTRALVEIGGQCWYRRNTDNVPTYFNPEPTWVNSSDEGWSGYYTGGPHANEGRLYQWSAAMNNSTTERAQGICPTGWHVPSDCEWMYLEDTLGMSITAQTATHWRSTTGEGTKLKNNGSSGFTVVMAGFRNHTGGEFWNSIVNGYFWTSTPAAFGESQRRLFANPQPGIFRLPSNPALAFSVRCIKD